MLSELLLAQRFSLAIYLRYGHQWTRAGDEPIVKAIRRISDDHELHADRITQLLLGREASVPHGHFPLEFTAHDETALSYLLPKLIQHERQMVERIEQSRGDWGADAEVRRLLETLLGVEKGHLETLTQLERALHSTS